MDFVKKNLKLLIFGAVIIIVLTAAFLSGSQESQNIIHNNDASSAVHESSVFVYSHNTEKEEGRKISVASDSYSSKESIIQSSVKKEKSSIVSSEKKKETEIPAVSEPEKTNSQIQTSVIETTMYDPQPEPEQQYSQDEFLPSPAPSIISSHEEKTTEKEYAQSCTLIISCETALNNDKLDKTKRSVLPENGIIFPIADVGFDEGESVFDVLKRECSKNGIHLDFSSVPLTGGAYIKGIGNLYEFDCGPVSGWMYRVNGEFPNIGCSEQKLHDGDEIAFLYSCDLGADIGNIYRGD